MLWPGSALARRGPSWVMVGELVETSRLWGRDVARIDPKWAEPLAEHLVKRTYSEPRWEPKRGAVVATERVTLYGLPIVGGRTVAYGRIDPELSRELFIRRALVEGDWETRHPFFAANQTLVEEVQRLEERARRRDILVSDQVLFDFFDARIPADVVSGAHFDRWWRDARRRDPELLSYTRELLVSPDAADALGTGGRPTGWRQGDLTLPLSYRFEPGSASDGVTVHVPLRVLPQLRDDGFEWLVPAFRLELVTALMRGLPKELRKRLVPVPDVAASVLERLEPRREPLLDALEREIEAQRGVRVPRSAWDLDRLAPHLRMTFRVEDDDGRLLAEGKDLDSVRDRARPRLRAELASETASLERRGLKAWTIGTLPREVVLPGTGDRVRAYPALVDEGDAVGVRSFETPAAQRAAMWAGTRRLLLLGAPPPGRGVLDRLGRNGPLTLSTAPHESIASVVSDATTAAVEALMTEAGGPAWDEAGFARLRSHVAGRLSAMTADVLVQVVAILDARRDVQRRLEELRSDAFAPARTDVSRQIGRLVYPGFVTATGVQRLPDVERYLRAAERRLERLPDAVAVDRDRMRAVQELEAEYARAREKSGRPLAEVRWMLEELRVAQFAQALGPKGQVSSKRIRRALAEAT
jgi:ATP-dependent helicase HrpA